MKLELKQIIQYLPYGLKIKILNHKCDYVGLEYGIANGYYFISDRLHVTYEGGGTGKDIDTFKPILRPMSDLIGHKIAKEIFNDEGWLTGKSFKETVSDFAYSNNHLDFCFAQYDWEKFYENHFDVFGLIEKGLAIERNFNVNDYKTN